VSGMNKTPAAAAADVMRLVELLISWLLIGGVVVSMAVVLVGMALMFVHHPECLRSAAVLQQLTEPRSAFPHTLHDIAGGVAAGRGQAVVALGLLLLVATPILRVAVSMAGFALQRDYAYTAITAAVLIVLLVSFFLGKAV
jgi:uncharacterized membrane protein